MSNNNINYIMDNLSITADKEIIYQDMLDEIIILNLKDDSYIGLDQAGANFWKIILYSPSVEEAYEQILSEYNVDPDTLKKDLNSFIHELLEKKLIHINHI